MPQIGNCLTHSSQKATISTALWRLPFDLRNT